MKDKTYRLPVGSLQVACVAHGVLDACLSTAGMPPADEADLRREHLADLIALAAGAVVAEAVDRNTRAIEELAATLRLLVPAAKPSGAVTSTREATE